MEASISLLHLLPAGIPVILTWNYSLVRQTMTGEDHRTGDYSHHSTAPVPPHDQIGSFQQTCLGEQEDDLLPAAAAQAFVDMAMCS